MPICDVRPPLSTRPLGTRLPLERLASHRRPNTLAVYWTERAVTDLSGNLSRPDGRIVARAPGPAGITQLMLEPFEQGGLADASLPAEDDQAPVAQVGDGPC